MAAARAGWERLRQVFHGGDLAPVHVSRLQSARSSLTDPAVSAAVQSALQSLQQEAEGGAAAARAERDHDAPSELLLQSARPAAAEQIDSAAGPAHLADTCSLQGAGWKQPAGRSLLSHRLSSDADSLDEADAAASDTAPPPPGQPLAQPAQRRPPSRPSEPSSAATSDADSALSQRSSATDASSGLDLPDPSRGAVEFAVSLQCQLPPHLVAEPEEEVQATRLPGGQAARPDSAHLAAEEPVDVHGHSGGRQAQPAEAGPQPGGVRPGPAQSEGVPPLTVVLMVVGTRGDVQPFIALGLALAGYGHRVRIASHAGYRDFVTEFGLEFYPLGGDPKILSEYVVRNRGILPSGLSLKDVEGQRAQLRDIIWSTWPACTAPDPAHPDRPFQADAIIANPPAYGHIHCAQSLRIPLHMFFTMPWTPTRAFPHPMARILYQYQVADRLIRLTDHFSYHLTPEDAYARVARGATRGVGPAAADHPPAAAVGTATSAAQGVVAARTAAPGAQQPTSGAGSASGSASAGPRQGGAQAAAAASDAGARHVGGSRRASSEAEEAAAVKEGGTWMRSMRERLTSSLGASTSSSGGGGAPEADAAPGRRRRRRRHVRERMAGWIGAFQKLGRDVILAQVEMANLLSYHAIDDILFPGMADLLNRFRMEVLGLPSLWHLEGFAHLLDHHKVPFTYCWSEALVPKPADWGRNISVVGFASFDLAGKTGFQPPPELAAFLAAGPPPVYIGFGSLVVDSVQKLSSKIYRALAETGQRAIISQGWAGLGIVPGQEVPPDVLLVDNVPHDWLFSRCAAVVHHGGAGTTAAGLLAGCPTTIVPFFGDQPFWGEACKRAGVGPAPIPIDSFRRQKLVAALQFMRQPEVRAAAERVGERMRAEDGAAGAAAAFHRNLPRHFFAGGRHYDWPAPRPRPTSSERPGLGPAREEPRAMAPLLVQADFQSSTGKHSGDSSGAAAPGVNRGMESTGGSTPASTLPVQPDAPAHSAAARQITPAGAQEGEQVGDAAKALPGSTDRQRSAESGDAEAGHRNAARRVRRRDQLRDWLCRRRSD